jgi:hypothetical protein
MSGRLANTAAVLGGLLLTRAMAVLIEPVHCHYLIVSALLSTANYTPMPSPLL